MTELEPIRKIIDGTTFNTETAYCFHEDKKMMAAIVDGRLENIPIVQKLYQTPDGQYFLAFWNKPDYDYTILEYVYRNYTEVINNDQAKEWILKHSPNLIDKFTESLVKSPAILETLTLRLPIDLRNHLIMRAKRENKSLNTLCIGYINLALLMRDQRY